MKKREDSRLVGDIRESLQDDFSELKRQITSVSDENKESNRRIAGLHDDMAHLRRSFDDFHDRSNAEFDGNNQFRAEFHEFKKLTEEQNASLQDYRKKNEEQLSDIKTVLQNIFLKLNS